jgi:hypothetical protein
MTSAEEAAVTKFAVRMVPFLGLMFFINYLDRTPFPLPDRTE